MTYLAGIRVLKPESRLFEPMCKIQLIVNAIGIGIMVVLIGKLETDPPIAQATCTQFPIIVRFPLLMVMQNIAKGEPVNEIGFQFAPKELPVVPPGKAQTTIKDYGRNALMAITPIYVDFYERHRGTRSDRTDRLKMIGRDEH
jgi:hypothetical protein